MNQIKKRGKRIFLENLGAAALCIFTHVASGFACGAGIGISIGLVVAHVLM